MSYVVATDQPGKRYGERTVVEYLNSRSE